MDRVALGHANSVKRHAAGAGFIREYDSVKGGVVVCDTLNHDFTATRK